MLFILARHKGDHAFTAFYAGCGHWTEDRSKAVTFPLSSSAYDTARDLRNKTKDFKIAVIAR